MKFKNQFLLMQEEKLKDFSVMQKIPVKVGFFLHKNIRLIKEAVLDIEQAKIQIGETYGTLKDDGSAYTIQTEYLKQAEQELYDLLNLEQDLNLHTFKLSEFEDIELTYEQLDAIAFMIEE